jgi:hypothetical protein
MRVAVGRIEKKYKVTEFRSEKSIIGYKSEKKVTKIFFY